MFRKISNLKSISISQFVVDLLFVIMWLIDAFYIQDSTKYFSDYMEYYNVYNGLKQNYFEIGYYYAGVVANFLGLSFFQFRMIVVSVTLFLMHNSILMYAKMPFFVSIVFFFHPFLLQCIQIRNALSLAIVIYGLRYIQSKEALKFVLCIIIGTTIHKSALLYLPLLLIFWCKPKAIIKISIFMVITLELVFVFFKKVFVMFVSRALHSDKILSYLNLNETRVITLSMVVYLIIYLMCIHYLIKNKKKNELVDCLFLMSSVLVFAYSPLMLVHYDYFRVLEYFLPVVSIGLSNSFYKASTQNKLVGMSVKAFLLSISIFQCIVWVVDNKNEVLGNLFFLK